VSQRDHVQATGLQRSEITDNQHFVAVNLR
jgi:hypothetical protein